MLTPQETLSLVLSYHAKSDSDPEYVADLSLDALRAAGYTVVNREQYLQTLASHAAKTINERVAVVRVVP